MLSRSCEYPIAGPRSDADVHDHGPIAEPFVAWNGFVLLIVTALSSYVF